MLSPEEFDRLVELLRLLNDPSVTQLDTDEQAELSAFMRRLLS